MKRLGKVAATAARILLAVAIFGYLLHAINVRTLRVDFAVPRHSADQGATYRDGADPSRLFTVLEKSEDGSVLRTVQTAGKRENLGENGTLELVSGNAPPALEWTDRTISRYGMRFAGDVLVDASRNWPWWLSGLAVFFGVVVLGTLRWQTVLHAQGVSIALPRLLGIFMIGHFFNSFMLGATGGDLVKAYYAARETVNKKAEVASTVFIDRLIGLPCLVGLAAVFMIARLHFFLSHPITRAALLFISVVAVGIAAGLVVVFRHNLFERWAFFRRMEERLSIGQTVRRVYDAFYTCRTQPRMLAKAVGFSVASQVCFILSAACFGRSLQLDVPLLDYFSLYPVILSVSAIPATPGGFGLREGATVLLMAAAGVPAVKSFPLSLLVFLSVLVWSLAGGVAFLLYPSARKGAPGGEPSDSEVTLAK